MTTPWSPTAVAHITESGYRIALQGVTYGDGTTQEAAEDDLVFKLLGILMVVRQGQLTMESGVPLVPVVIEWLLTQASFVAEGGDIRERIFPT